MSSTSPLFVLCSSRLPENRLNMHPNEGADLGLMMTQHSARTGEGVDIELYLLNECPKESLEINPRFWERLGRPKKAIISYDGTLIKIEKA